MKNLESLSTKDLKFINGGANGEGDKDKLPFPIGPGPYNPFEN